jgi:hypothetical protein
MTLIHVANCMWLNIKFFVVMTPLVLKFGEHMTLLHF